MPKTFLKAFAVVTLIGLPVASYGASGAQSNLLKGTVVLRIDNRDGSKSITKEEAHPKNQSEAQSLAKDNSNFGTLPDMSSRSELDRDGGVSSWYFYYPNYYLNGYGTYGYGTYAYTPYGTLAYNPYGAYAYNPYYYYPTVSPSSVYPTYYYYGSAYSPYYVYNYGPYSYYYYGLGW